jgi:hypothetical protein
LRVKSNRYSNRLKRERCRANDARFVAEGGGQDHQVIFERAGELGEEVTFERGEK